MRVNEPWEMSESEWERAFEDTKPNTMQTNFTRHSGSEAVRKFNTFLRLRFSICNPHHIEIVLRALYLGKPVPSEVVAGYSLEQYQRAAMWRFQGGE